MNELRLTDDEKAALRLLYENAYDINNFSNFPQHRVSAALESLHNNMLIDARLAENGSIIYAKINSSGKSYVDSNPNLNDPASVEIEKLQKENLILQNNDLEYRATIRQQERVIRFWQVSNAVVGLFGLLGWLLGFLQLL